MQEQQRNPRSLSDISHLFLSSVRERQTGASPRPQRTPPPRHEAAHMQTSDHRANDELTDEEFQHVLKNSSERENESAVVPPVKAVIASHLGGRQFDCVRSYARS